MMSWLFFASFLIFFGSSELKHLPSYIIPCKKSDPNINKCAIQHAIDAIPYVLKGDTPYKLPSFLPFNIPLIDIKGTPGLSFQLKNLKLYGLNTSEVKDVNFDIPNNHMYVKVFILKTNSECQYTVDGKVLSLVMKGEGPARISSDNITVEYFIDYQFIKKSDGKRYIDVNNLKTKLIADFGKNHYYFGNLFGGNKLLSDNFNNLLNENPKEVEELSGEANKEIVRSIVSTVFNAIFKSVPFDEIFID